MASVAGGRGSCLAERSLQVILQNGIARLLGFATCGSPRGSKEGKEGSGGSTGGSGQGAGAQEISSTLGQQMRQKVRGHLSARCSDGGKCLGK